MIPISIMVYFHLRVFITEQNSTSVSGHLLVTKQLFEPMVIQDTDGGYASLSI